MPRRRRFWKILLAVFAALLALLVWAAWPGRWTYTISPETTYITGPLDKDGHVDYVAALHERLSKGVTPENNANVLIWKALGPRPDSSNMPPQYFIWLGIQPPPEQGVYFAPMPDSLRADIGFSPDFDSVLRFDKAVLKPWAVADLPKLPDWLDRNEQPLALLIEASRREHYYNPHTPPTDDEISRGLLESPFPTLKRCRDAAWALIYRALLRLKKGRLDDAWQDLLACHRLARVIGRGGTLVEAAVGFDIDANAHPADLLLLNYAKPSRDQLGAFRRDLASLPPLPDIAGIVNLGERFAMLELITLTARHGRFFLKNIENPSRIRKPLVPEAELFRVSIDWDPALRKANQWLDRAVAVLSTADYIQRQQQLHTFSRDFTSLKQTAPPDSLLEAGNDGRGEYLGDVMVVRFMPAFARIQAVSDRAEQLLRNLDLAMALAAYRNDHRVYPTKLDDLVPKYIDDVPDDLFSGEPLVYQPEHDGYLLYSVGPNKVDQEGRGPDDEPRGDDITVRIPLPEPKK